MLGRFYAGVLLAGCIALGGYAQEEEALGAHEALGAIFLQISTEAFFSDFESQKEQTEEHAKRLEQIQEAMEQIRTNMAFLAKEFQKSKQSRATLLEHSSVPKGEGGVSREEFEQLKEMMVQLGSMVAATQGSAALKQEENLSLLAPFALKVAVNSAPVRAEPRIQSPVIGELKRGAIVETSHCNRYGWCKLAQADGYIQRYLCVRVSE